MRVPTHGIDDAAEFVELSKDNWELDTVQKEQKEMEAAGEPPEDHPVAIYFSGESRFSLDATSVVLGQTRSAREYVKKDATYWMLKRLPRRQYRTYLTLFRQDNRELANETAVQLGVSEVRGPRGVKLTGGGDMPLSSDDLDRIWELDTTLIDRLAEAIITYSQPITRAEGKS